MASAKMLPISETSFKLDPTLQLKSLDGQKTKLLDLVSQRKATLLTVSCSSFSDSMIESFRQPFLKSPQIPSAAGLIDLRPIPSLIKYAVWGKLVKRAARQTVPVELYPGYFVYWGGKELRQMFGLPNLFGGYAIVLDGSGVVRWRASGTATESELQTMVDCFKQLAKK